MNLLRASEVRTLGAWRYMQSLVHWTSSEGGLAKRASLSAIAETLDIGVQMLVQFVLNPLLLIGLGDFLFGAWATMWRLGDYLHVATGRSAQPLKWVTASLQSSTDYEEKSRHLGNAIAVSLLFFPLVMVVGGLLVWILPIGLNTPEESVGSVRLAFGILVITVIVLSFAEIPRSVLRGENQDQRRLGLSALLILVGGGLVALALHFGQGIVGVSLATLANAMLTGAVFFILARRYERMKRVPSFSAIPC